MRDNGGISQEHLCGGTPDDAPTPGEALNDAIWGAIGRLQDLADELSGGPCPGGGDLDLARRLTQIAVSLEYAVDPSARTEGQP